MKPSNLAVAAAGILFACAVVYHRCSIAERGPHSMQEPKVGVRNALEPCWTEGRAIPESRQGLVAFRTDDASVVAAVSDAVAYAGAEGGRPDVMSWIDVSGLQLGPQLDLRPYLRNTSGAGDVFLKYTLRLRSSDPAIPEFRVGWARFPRSMLETSAVEVEARTADPVVIEIATAAGQAVPDLVLGIDPPRYPRALVTHYVQAGSTGKVRVSGVTASAARELFVPITDGPFALPKPVELGPRAAASDVVRVELPVFAQLRFATHSVRGLATNQHLYASLSAAEERADPPDDVWLTNPWSPPGNPEGSSVTLAAPATSRAERDLWVTVNAEPPQLTGPWSQPCELRVDPRRAPPLGGAK